MAGKGKRSYQRRTVGFSALSDAPRGQIQQQHEPVEVEEIEPFEVTENDLMNHFLATVEFPFIDGMSESAERYAVVGRQTVDVLGSKVAFKLWLDDKVLCSHVAVTLYENGILCAPETVLAELLKRARRERRGDGVSLTFECVVTGFWGEEYEYFE